MKILKDVYKVSQRLVVGGLLVHDQLKSKALNSRLQLDESWDEVGDPNEEQVDFCKLGPVSSGILGHQWKSLGFKFYVKQRRPNARRSLDERGRWKNYVLRFDVIQTHKPLNLPGPKPGLDYWILVLQA